MILKIIMIQQICNIIFIILVQIDNLSKRFELSQISNIFYQKLSNIYKKGDFPNPHFNIHTIYK